MEASIPLSVYLVVGNGPFLLSSPSSLQVTVLGMALPVPETRHA